MWEKATQDQKKNPGKAVVFEIWDFNNHRIALFCRGLFPDKDAFTSATKNKTRTGTLAGGSYHTKSDGTEVTGITFPVKVGEGVDLSAYKEVKDSDSVDITVTNRGQTSTTTYVGKDALFENESYAYYVLDEVPAYYKEVTANGGSLSFGPVVGEKKQVSASAELETQSSYGDYQLGLDGISCSTEKVYGVIISTKEGNDYGLRHLENIWRGTELAWCTGFTDKVHNCPVSSAHYEKMMGQTINKITYYTADGIYEIPVNLYVPKKFNYALEVTDAPVTAGSTTVEVSGLPKDYQAKYEVEGLETSVKDGVLSYENAKMGKYTLTIKDESGIYAPISTTFELFTEAMPAKYNMDDKNPALVINDGASAEEFADFLSKIEVVSVNGQSYSASGKRATVLIDEDGTLKTDAEPFKEDGTYTICVSATGYKDLEFVYSKSEVDTTALEQAIKKAGELKETEFTKETWKALEGALENANVVLEEAKSQEAVDAATEELLAAIKELKKAEQTNAGNIGNNGNAETNNNTGNSSNPADKKPSANAQNSKNPQTGDPANLLGLMAMALASAGVGSFAFKKKRENK
ncbi:DUF1533 domain-containing protein [Roseburia hominis]